MAKCAEDILGDFCGKDVGASVEILENRISADVYMCLGTLRSKKSAGLLYLMNIIFAELPIGRCSSFVGLSVHTRAMQI